jgi:aromatic ring-opening dioxygenase LigB subunit
MLVGACFVPHPPVIVPCVGRGRENEAAATVAAMRQVAQSMVALHPDTLLLLSPHATASRQHLPLHVADRYEGSFRRFGAPKPAWSFSADTDLIEGLTQVRGVTSIAKSDLDHGALVPLAFLAEAGYTGQLVVLGLPLANAAMVESYGRLAGKAIADFPKRVAAVMSGDMSHALTLAAPNGYSPYGRQFDDAFVAAMKDWNTPALLNFDSALAERGAQDALWSAQFLVGLLHDIASVRPQFLSYEGPFGVGYMVEAFTWASAA